MDVPPGRGPRRLPAWGPAVVLGVALAVTPAWAAAGAVGQPVALATDPADPGGGVPTTPPDGPGADPTTAPPTVEPPEETTPPPVSGTPTPVGSAPATATPTAGVPTPLPGTSSRPPVRPSAPGTAPGPSPLGVRVTTGDVVLPQGYWNTSGTATTLRVTVANTGSVDARVHLSYTLPAGVTDAGTAGCAATGGHAYRCGGWRVAAGDRFSTLIRVRVSGDAWRRMPLSGSVTVSASAPGVSGTARDDEGFAVLFPPGPPAPGITVEARGVSFDVSGAASDLIVRLANTGTVDAAGRIDVLLPAGVTVPAPPAGCAPLDAARTRCDLGVVRAGDSADLRLPVEATPAAQREAPLAGAVVGRLDPGNGRARQVRTSFRITAAAALATPVAVAVPTGSQGVLVGGAALPDVPDAGSTRRTVIMLVVASALLVALALGLATLSLRRRLAGEPQASADGDLDYRRAGRNATKW